MVGKTLAHYTIEGPLGAGGMGKVYRARDTRLDRAVAIKLVDSEIVSDDAARARLLREARTASGLNHPHICTIYEVNDQGDQTFIAMELVEGRTLSSLVEPGGLPAELVVRYGAQIADAIAHAHEHGVVHRDLKAANVIITPEGRAKVLDFGIAKRLVDRGETTATGTPPTAAGTVTGTLAYLAPEVLKGEAADARSDIWALGVLLYELASGERPFHGETGFEVSSAILRDAAPPLPPHVGSGLAGIILRCLAKDPHHRYARASEVQAALEALGTGAAAATATGRRSARRAYEVGLAALVAGLAIGGAYLLRQRPEPGRETAGPIRIAVLPFHLMAGSEEVRFLSVGVPDAIITKLANVGQIRVRPTNAILRYENQTPDPQEAGRALNADYVLTGTAQKAGEQLRVSVQMVRVSDGAPLWGQRYDLSRADLLGLQDQIADRVASALEIRMTAAERERLYRRYTENIAAYEAYLRGRSLLLRRTQRETEEALTAFEAALQRDPGYALAHAGLALASAEMRIRFAPDEAAVKKWETRAKEEAAKALELDRGLAEAHEALAAVYGRTEFDWERTIAESRLALELNPNLDGPHANLARAFYHLGLLEAAAREAAAAAEINPENRVEPGRNRAFVALLEGRTADSISILEPLRPLSPSAIDWSLALAYHTAGRRAEAEAILAEPTGGVSERARSQVLLAAVVAARGEKSRARSLVREAIATGYMDHHVAYYMGATAGQLGDLHEARRRLKEAADTGFPCYPWFARDQLLAPLRGDAAFEQFMAELRKAWETAKARYEGTSAAGR